MIFQICPACGEASDCITMNHIRNKHDFDNKRDFIEKYGEIENEYHIISCDTNRKIANIMGYGSPEQVQEERIDRMRRKHKWL